MPTNIGRFDGPKIVKQPILNIGGVQKGVKEMSTVEEGG